MGELAVLCAAYSISLFYRGMLAVIAPELSLELMLNESMLGLLASAFFISFAIAQIPCGILLDRFGGRLTVAGFLWIAVCGTLLFSVADSYYPAILAQVLLGVGCAPIFTGTMLFIGRRFAPLRFAYITALVIAIGSVGDLLGTTPLAMLADALGWRNSLRLMALITALIAILCLFGLSSDKPPASNETLRHMLQGMGRILRIRPLWPLLPMFLVSYAVLMAIRGVWSGPYLADLYGSDATERGFILMAMSVAMAVGTFMLGLLDRRFQNTKAVVMISSVLATFPLILLALYPAESTYVAMWAFITLGLFGFNYPLLMSHSRTFLSSKYLGRGMAVLTAASFIGVALVQAGSGWLLKWAATQQVSPAEQYQVLFVTLAIMMAIATLIYCFSSRQGKADQPVSTALTHGKEVVSGVL